MFTNNSFRSYAKLMGQNNFDLIGFLAPHPKDEQRTKRKGLPYIELIIECGPEEGCSVSHAEKKPQDSDNFFMFQIGCFLYNSFYSDGE
jgi:hypothetical protein